MYVKHTGLALERVNGIMERDYFMNPVEAKELGLIDVVLTTPVNVNRGVTPTTENLVVVDTPKPPIEAN